MHLRDASRIAIALVAIAFPLSLRADQSARATLALDTFLNLDTGATTSASSDILWDGAVLMPQGRAGLHYVGKYGSRGFKAIAASSAATAPYSFTPITAGSLAAGNVFGVRTNKGHFAKVLVTESAGGALSIQYITFGAAVVSTGAIAAATGPTPIITQVQNNYSYILPGLPNYGIAPGSLFVIFGTGLGSTAPPVLQSSAAPGLPTTLNQTSVSVTVNGTTTTPALYYATSTGVAAVLPSTTPVGNGVVTVTYAGQASAPAPIRVVANAIGLDTLYGTGNGAGVATDINFKVLSLTNSAAPGQTIVLWGSGIGADTASDDRTYPQNQDNLTNVPMQIYVGGVAANILYRGRSQYPGLDQFDIVVPSNVPPGCYVSVVALTGNFASNTITLPVAPAGGPCSDPGTGLSGSQLQSLANKTSVNTAGITITQITEPSGSVNSSAILFASTMNGANFGKGYEYASQGSCALIPPQQGQLPNVLQAPLDPGAIQLTGPAGSLAVTGGSGFYQANLPGSGTAAPGTYTFAASGGANIGSFRTSVNLQGPLTLTNKPALGLITRSLGANVAWTGGFSNGDVQIEGEVGGQFGTVRFYCHAPSSAGQFFIPASILMAMPTGTGDLVVTNSTAPQTIAATGLDVGLAIAQVIIGFPSTFK